MSAERALSRKTIEDRVAAAAPGLYRALARLVFAAWLRLPRDSRLRRAFMTRQVRRAFDAFARTDPDEAFVYVHSDFVWDASAVRDWPERAVYRGPAEFREFIRDWSSAFGEFRVELEDARDLGEGRILALSRLHATGRESAVATTTPWAQVFTLRHGLVSRVENYSDRREALAAVGLMQENQVRPRTGSHGAGSDRPPL